MSTYNVSNTEPTLYYYRIAPGDTNIIPVLVYDVNVELSGNDVGTCSNMSQHIKNRAADLPPYGFTGCNWVDTSKGAETGVATFDLNNLVLKMSPIGDQYHLYIPKQDSLDNYVASFNPPDTSPTKGYSVLRGILFGVLRGANNTQALIYIQTIIYQSSTATFKLPTPGNLGAGFASSFFGSAGKFDLSRSPVYDACAKELMSKAYEYNPDNPYQGGDEPNNPGDGTFDYSSDVIHVPGLPTTSVVDSGLVSLYAPTPAELQALGNYLWSDAFSVDTFKKMFNNPMDCILGLSLIPVKVPTGGSKEITVGNIVSTVSCTVCTSQYVEVDCGTFTFNRSNFTGSFLDYSPYLKCFLFLPFIGMNEIDMDEWQNSTMGVVYHVDVLTGAMFCFVTRNGSVIMTYSGQCSENVPLSSNDFTTTIGSILGVASTAVGAVATVATAGSAAPAAAAAGGLSEAALGARTGASLAGAGVSTASQVGSMKPSIRHSGCVGGGAGIMGVKAPYLLFIAPRMATPNNQEKYTGFSSNKIVELSTCSGYTEVQAINLHIKNANDMEMAEIENGLKTGVIL